MFSHTEKQAESEVSSMTKNATNETGQLDHESSALAFTHTRVSQKNLTWKGVLLIETLPEITEQRSFKYNHTFSVLGLVTSKVNLQCRIEALYSTMAVLTWWSIRARAIPTAPVVITMTIPWIVLLVTGVIIIVTFPVVSVPGRKYNFIIIYF